MPYYECEILQQKQHLAQDFRFESHSPLIRSIPLVQQLFPLLMQPIRLKELTLLEGGTTA